MKALDSRYNDTRIIESSGNVFVDLGFDAAEAQVMSMRVELMLQLREKLNQQGFTQDQAARQLGTTQSKITALLNGTWKNFTIDTLLKFATRLGLHPQLTVT